MKLLIALLFFVVQTVDANTLKSSSNIKNIDTFSITGVWSNNESGFKQGSLIFYEHQRGMLLGGGVSAAYFSWKMNSKTNLMAELFVKQAPIMNGSYNASSKELTIELVQENKTYTHIYTKTKLKIPPDNVIRLLNKEKEKAKTKQIKREKWLEKREVKKLTNIDLTQLKKLYLNEISKNSDFSLGLYLDNIDSRSYFSLSKKENTFNLSFYFGDALDNSMPKKLTKQSWYKIKPNIDIQERLFIKSESEEKILSYLNSRDVKYTSRQMKLSYFDGYKTGYKNYLSFKLDTHLVTETVINIFEILSQYNNNFNVKITKIKL